MAAQQFKNDQNSAPTSSRIQVCTSVRVMQAHEQLKASHYHFPS